MIKIEFFIEKIYECNLHKTRLLLALENLQKQNLIPLELKDYENLSSEQSSFIDQIIFRFSKLQDTIGEKSRTSSKAGGLKRREPLKAV